MKSACGGRMPESVELCIQINTPTTPRHHRDEELPVANVRICRTVCTDQQLVNSSNIDNLRIYRTVDTHRPRVSESTEPLIHIGRGCVIKKHNVKINRTVAKKRGWVECHMERIVAVRIRDTWTRGSTSIELLTHIDTVVRKCETVHNLSWSRNACLRPPKTRDVNRLFAETTHRHQQV